MITSQIPDRRIPYCVSVERVEASWGRGTSGLAQPVKLLVFGEWGSNTKKRDFCSSWPLTGRYKFVFDGDS